MGNPYVQLWEESGEVELPPIGQVDNPYIQAWQEQQQGRGEGMLGSSETHAERVAGNLAITGSIIHGFVQPLVGLLDFPGAVARGVGFIDETERLITDRAAGVVRDWNNGVRYQFEERARDLGFSEEELRGVRMLGNLIGFVAPGVGLYKGVGRALGVTEQGLLAAPFMAGLKVDVASGLVWGGVLTEGEIQDRLKNAALDGGMSGAVGLALTGVWPAVAAYRGVRAANRHYAGLHEQQKRELLGRFYTAKRAGEIGAPAPLTAPEARSVFDMMSEESLFVNSPAAQQILARNADETALVAAITDVAGAGANSGVVKQIGDDFPAVVELTDKFRAEFPTLKFSELKNPEGGYDVVFGTRGLSNAQKKHYSQYGRYPGQRLQHVDGIEYEYIAPAQEGWVKAKRLDTGSEVRVKLANVVDTPYGIEPALRAPGDDALFTDFDSFFRTNSAKVLNERYQLSEVDLVRLARDGQLSEEVLGRRKIREPNAVVMPDEAAQGWRVERVEISPNQQIAGAENAVHWNILDPTGRQAGSIVGRLQGDALEVIWASATSSGPPGVPLLRGEQGSIGAGNVRKLLDQIVDQFESMGIKIRTVKGTRNRPDTEIPGIDSGDQFIEIPIHQRVRQAGAEETWQLHPWEAVDFEDTVRLWAQDRGLPTEGGEFISLQTNFAARMREKLLTNFNRDYPQEAALLETLKQEWGDLINAQGLPFDARAAVKGFHAERLGRGWRLRDMNSGAAFEFADDAAAEAALQRALRGDRDISPSQLPPNTIDQIASPNAVPARSVEEILVDALPENALAESMTQDIPTRVTTQTVELFKKYEDRTGMPLWSLGVNKIDEGGVRALQEFSVWAKDLDNMWAKNGVKNRDHATRLGEYLVRVESAGVERGSRLIPSERSAIAREMGLTRTDMQALKQYRRIMDAGFQEYGIPAGDYIEDYFGRILPYVRKKGALGDNDFAQIFPEGIPDHLTFFAEHQRIGHLPNIEMDPRLVAAKWFRSATFKRHLDEPWQFVAKTIKMRVKDLPKEQRIKLINAAGRRVDPNETVIPEPLVNILKEYLNSIRGAPVSSVRGVQNVFRKIYEKLGIQVDERISTEFFNTMLATMYGSAMGLRPMLLARNHLQTMWNLYPRLGGKHFNGAMRDVLDLEKFRHAYDAGALRSPLAGISNHDAIFEEIVEAGAKGTGLFSNAVASAMNASLHAGKLSRSVAEKTLIPYGMGDNFSRAWAFHYQRRHTADYLQQLTRKKISEEKFYELGLPFFSRPVREEFAKRLRFQGPEHALDFIGKLASDETHFIYGMGNQPAWMQNPFGKFMGMFGTWPLGQKEVMFRMMQNGTPGQRVAAHARMAGIGGALALVGTSVGVNMWSWAAPLFMTWTGGPGVDYAIQLKNVIDAPLDQKSQALGRLAEQIPRLAFPGQVLMSDLGAAAGATDDPALQALYVMLGRPTETHFIDIVTENYPPSAPGRVTDAAPTSAAPAATLDFNIDLEALGLAPQVAGSVNVSTQQNRYQEALDYLGGNIPR